MSFFRNNFDGTTQQDFRALIRLVRSDNTNELLCSDSFTESINNHPEYIRLKNKIEQLEDHLRLFKRKNLIRIEKKIANKLGINSKSFTERDSEVSN